ncbi:MAG: methionine biosynthesis protein MetW [bacterium]|nr:methionine biosynthesis protein MetW [bacterium]
MRGLYGKYYNPSYKKVADLIPDNSSVVDVCCGSGKLYEFLKNKNVAYVGLDGSKPFIKYLRDKGIDARLTDVNGDPIPTADYIILQRSLYQFKNPDILIRKLIGSAKKSLIISESVQNLGQSSSLLVNKILHKIVPYFVGTNFNDTSFRFTEQEFTHLLKRYHPKFKKISGGKDLVAVINKIET